MKKRLQRLWWALLTLDTVRSEPVPWRQAAVAAPIIIVADTRKLDGIMAWWANLTMKAMCSS